MREALLGGGLGEGLPSPFNCCLRSLCRFLGSVVCWSGNAWRWEVRGSTPADADDVRRILTLAGADQAALERLVSASTPRTKHFAREWGLM